MAKVELAPQPALYPMPLVLAGANVDGKPNYLTVAFAGIVCWKPPMISLALGQRHYTNAGIKANRTFSVNIPSVDQVQVTDYCGLVSGSKTDKSGLFKNFYGRLRTAPMIEECPLNLECKLVQTLELSGQDVFIGEIVAMYAEEKYLTDGAPDVAKMEPLVFTMPDNNYWRLGPAVGKGWSTGKGLKKA